MKKLRTFYWRTLGFIALCIVLYLTACRLCIGSWPRFMAGGEPIPHNVLDNPSMAKILDARTQFVTGWQFHSYYGLCAFTLVLACTLFALYILLCLRAHTLYDRHKRHIRRLLIALDLQVSLSAWHQLFAISGIVRNICSLAMNIAMLALCLYYVIYALGTAIYFLKALISWIPGFWWNIIWCLLYFASALGTSLRIEWLQLMDGAILQGFTDIISPFLLPRQMVYTLKAPIQYLIAGVPVLLPLLYLCLCCWLCHPRSVGAAPVRERMISFISLDKR